MGAFIVKILIPAVITNNIAIGIAFCDVVSFERQLPDEYTTCVIRESIKAEYGCWGIR